MRKFLKIMLVTVVVLVVVAIASLSVVVLDVAGSFATDAKALPHGAAIGRALVVYDPGLSGGAKDVATKIGYELQDSGYDVVLAGAKSTNATQISNYKVIVVGGPIYVGKPASSIQTYLNNLIPSQGTKVGAFGYGSVKIDNGNATAVAQDVAPLPAGSSLKPGAVMKATSEDNLDSLISNFVSTLLNQ